MIAKWLVWICSILTSVAFGCWFKDGYAGVFMFGLIFIWIEAGE